MFGLFAKPTRRRSSRGGGGGGGKMLDTALAIAVIGGVAIVGYYMLKSGKGIQEGLDTGGRGLKNITDAIDSTFDFIADRSYDAQKGAGAWFEHSGRADERIVKGLQDTIGGVGNTIMGLGCGYLRKC